MPSTVLTRRRTHRARPESSGLRLGVVAAGLSILGIAGLAIGMLFLSLAQQLPDVGRIESQFGLRGVEHHRPLLVYDRSGEQLLFQNLHPGARDRIWIDPADLPNHVIEALVAALDPTFWSNPGYLTSSVISSLRSPVAEPSTITLRLVSAALLPPTSSQFEHTLAGAVLAAELTSRYPKDRILAWYLNGADFGNSAYGIDAAALVYFGKSATALSLSEAALLAAMARDPSLDPVSEAESAEMRRAVVLQAMQRAGNISSTEAERVARQPLGVMASASEWAPAEHLAYLLQQLEQILGRAALGRSGLRVISTIDQDLQDQSACTAESHLRRLSGDPAGTVVPTVDSSPCVSASLLPTLRPGDAGLDHHIDEWGLVVIDSVRGEVLAAHGPLHETGYAGPVLDPFIYLTAFSRGSTPATMILDLQENLIDSHGPVRMRTALINMYPGASDRTLEAVGTESFWRTLGQVGIVQAGELLTKVGLLDVVGAYGVIAADGLRIGIDLPELGIRPSIVLRVEEDDGQLVYEYSPAQQAILGPQLSHLMVDILTDASARRETLGQASLLELGFPAGVVSGITADSDSNWTIGFTPQRVIGVWLGGSPMRSVDRLNGSVPIWHAVTRFATAELPVRGWQRPPGLTELDVCDPSGLLPTVYCPTVVKEVFIQGTEPTHFDSLFKPFRVNQETGKLATLFTPLQAVEERVYFIPPAEAAAWAKAVGIEQPPEEYDRLAGSSSVWPGVGIGSPASFEVIGDQIPIMGEAAPQGFQYYRLQYGQGLNPTNWVQIGGDRSARIVRGRLGTWSTEGLSGLYTLQLLVILSDGQVRTAAIAVTVDNQAPEVRITSPVEGAVFRMGHSTTTILQADAVDNVSLQRLEFWVDDQRVGTVTSAPFTYHWSLPDQVGEYAIEARAYDAAGNRAVSDTVVIGVLP